MTIKPSPQTQFENDISLLDIKYFFKVTYKKILFFMILGAVLGIYFGKLYSQNYKAKFFISAPTAFGNVLINEVDLYNLLSEDLILSKETNLTCFSIQKYPFYRPSVDSFYIFLDVKNKEKEIYKCQQEMANDINNYFKEKKDKLKNKYENNLRSAISKRDYLEVLMYKTRTLRLSNYIELGVRSDLTKEIFMINETISEIEEKLNNQENSNEKTVLLVKLIQIKALQKFFLFGTFFGGFFGILLGLLKISLSKKKSRNF